MPDIRWARRSRDRAWFSHPARPLREVWSHTRHPPVECPTLPHGSWAHRSCRIACAEIPNAMRIDLTKDCLCTPLLFLKGMIFPLGLWYSFFSIIRSIFSIREMSYCIPCPFPHQKIFFLLSTCLCACLSQPLLLLSLKAAKL